MSSQDWATGLPIFHQIKRQIENRVVDGEFPEGSRLPSVRQLAVDLSVNPLTVMRAYQELVDLGLIEKQRGIGMRVSKGASIKILEDARQSFLKEEWPAVVIKLRRLGLKAQDLLD